MAIVAEYIVNGIHVQVADDCYVNCTEEEIAARRKDAQRIAWEIQLQYFQRQQEQMKGTENP